MKITVATYNILHGYYLDKISTNIKILVDKGVDILCIQEGEIPVEDFLPEGWQIEYFYTKERGCRLVTAWDSSKVTKLEINKFLLPGLTKPSLGQKITAYKTEKIQRGAMEISFSINDKVLRVTNTHLAWEGGTQNRLNQLKNIVLQLATGKADSEILVGDFNTFIPSAFRRGQEKKVERVLGNTWDNVFPNLAWTCDVSYTDPQDGFEGFRKFCEFFRIKMQSRLDYIFSKKLKIISKEMLDLPGSDHRPLVATFEI